MYVGDFYAAEAAANAAINAARKLPLNPEFDGDLSDVASILAEVRHFASCWHDNVENLRSGAVNGVVGDRIKAQLIERLVAFCKPSEMP